MSRKFLVPIDLTQQELQNARIQNLASAPSSPVAGQIYYNTGSNQLFFYNGSSWVTPSTTQITVGLLSARPTAATAGANAFYFATDNNLLYESNGTSWAQVSTFGTGLSSTVAIAGSASDGTSTNYARADHAHAGPAFATPTAQTTYGASSTTGTATTVPHSDHTHGTPSLSTNAASNVTATTATNGSGTAPAKDDHVHGFTPSGFALSAFGVPTGAVAFNAQKITGLADPTAAQDAATKNYVDNTASGFNVHPAVEVATTVSLTTNWTYNSGSAGADGGTGVGATLVYSAAGTLTIDGHALATGDRILVKNQSTALQNGVYLVGTIGGSTITMTRATDYDNHLAGQVGAGDITFVAAGGQAATSWVEVSTGTSTTPVNGIKLGTDSLSYTQYAVGATYTAGAGLTLTTGAFAFAPSSTGGLTVGGTGATAAVLLATNSGLGTTSSGLAVGAGTGITVSTGTVAIDTTVVARKFSQTLSTSATSYTITHNLGTLDVIVQVYTVSDGSEVIVDNLRATTNTVTLNFSVAPTANAYRVVILG